MRAPVEEQMSNEEQKPPEEAELIRRILRGEQELFRDLVIRYQDMVFAMIMRQTGDQSLAEELTQEAFIKAYSALSSFRSEAKFSTWLIRIALNHTNSYYSSKAYKQSRRSETFELNRHDTDDPCIEEQQHLKEQLNRFRKCLGKLKPNFREIITLCGLEGKSYEEAASIIGIPVGTVRSRLNKARLLLKECMQREEQAETAS